MNIKYLLEDTWNFIKYDLKELFDDLKNLIIKIFTVRYYIYILLGTLIFLLVRDIENILLYAVIAAMILIKYKKYKTGDHRAWMRKKKGYKV